MFEKRLVQNREEILGRSKAGDNKDFRMDMDLDNKVLEISIKRTRKFLLFSTLGTSILTLFACF